MGRRVEGGRRITVSPRPCCGRRVVAKKRPGCGGTVDGFVNSVKKLQRREVSSKRDRAFSMTDAQERFHNIRLQDQIADKSYLGEEHKYEITESMCIEMEYNADRAWISDFTIGWKMQEIGQLVEVDFGAPLSLYGSVRMRKK